MTQEHAHQRDITRHAPAKLLMASNHSMIGRNV